MSEWERGGCENRRRRGWVQGVLCRLQPPSSPGRSSEQERAGAEPSLGDLASESPGTKLLVELHTPGRARLDGVAGSPYPDTALVRLRRGNFGPCPRPTHRRAESHVSVSSPGRGTHVSSARVSGRSPFTATGSGTGHTPPRAQEDSRRGQGDVPTGAHSVATVTRGVPGREQGLPGSLLPANQKRRGHSFSPFRSVQPVCICGDLLCACLPWRAQTGCSWPGPAPGRGQAAGQAPSSTCAPWGTPLARECDPSRRGHHFPPVGAYGARGPAPRGRRALTRPRNLLTAKACVCVPVTS